MDRCKKGSLWKLPRREPTIDSQRTKAERRQCRWLCSTDRSELQKVDVGSVDSADSRVGNCGFDVMCLMPCGPSTDELFTVMAGL